MQEWNLLVQLGRMQYHHLRELEILDTLHIHPTATRGHLSRLWSLGGLFITYPKQSEILRSEQKSAGFFFWAFELMEESCFPASTQLYMTSVFFCK